MPNYLICALILISILWNNSALAKSYMGLIVEREIPQECQIVREGKRLPCETRKLFIGDRIEGKSSLKEMKVHLHPLSQLSYLPDGSATLIANPQELNEGCIRDFIDNFIGKEGHYEVMTAIRATQTDIGEGLLNRIRVTPPPFASVLPDIPIIFRWRKGEGERLIIEDASGQVVVTESLANHESLRLIPRESGLRPGHEYTWYYEGDVLQERYQIGVLDLKSQPEGLLQILDRVGKSDDIDESIFISSYLQTLSDSSLQIDLYWLSFQILPRSLDFLDGAQRLKVLNLISRYLANSTDF